MGRDSVSGVNDEQLRSKVQSVMPAVLAGLDEHIRIRSVSSLPEHADDVRASAEWIVDQLKALGCPDVEMVVEGGQPAVIGRFPAPEGQPTVCLYAHHDVQPTGDVGLWTTPPFEPTVRDGRLYARGASDDKAGVATHLAVLRAFDGRPPVGVTVFIEGEEEIGSPSLTSIIERHHDQLAADVYVINDAGNWDTGVPGFNTTLRGIADCVVEVRTLDHALHSGMAGGVVPDALTALCKLLATLHDERGNVAIEGLRSFPAPDLDYPIDRLRQETGLLDGVEWLGDGTVVERMWTKPSVTVLAIDAPSVANASNTLQPVARAKVSLRVPPGSDAAAAEKALIAHLETHAPWGARVSVTPGDFGQPGIVALDGEIGDLARAAWADAFGKEPVELGSGGSIPMIAEFQEAFPGAFVLVPGPEDPLSCPHGIDESQDLADLEHLSLAEALFLSHLAH